MRDRSYKSFDDEEARFQERSGFDQDGHYLAHGYRLGASERDLDGYSRDVLYGNVQVSSENLANPHKYRNG